ncbi:MAG: hypothetical protein KGJ89_01050 [Patescibacteria group bacterium]|nr:hypothetical protein [Patescibacteria group bacterium]MDE2226528.1 hypothetical protein [Patescibacteria group bacterium]
MFARQAAEFDHALERNGCTPDFVKWLSTGTNLSGVRDIYLGNAEIKMLEFWKTMEDVAVRIPALKQPTLEELRRAFSQIEKIESDSSPTDEVILRLGTLLRSDEKSIVGSEYERRLVSRRNLVLGYQQAVWLVEHQDEFPVFMSLLGKVYIDFPGLVVLYANGYRNVPYLSRNGERWYLGRSWLDCGFNRNGRVASK